MTLEAESVIGLGRSAHKGFDLLRLDAPDNRRTLIELQETRKRKEEAALVSFDGPFRQSPGHRASKHRRVRVLVRSAAPLSSVPQPGAFARRENDQSPGQCPPHRFSAMEVIISRIQLCLVQAYKTLMAALQQSDQFVDPLNVIVDGKWYSPGLGATSANRPTSARRPEELESENRRADEVIEKRRCIHSRQGPENANPSSIMLSQPAADPSKDSPCSAHFTFLGTQH